MSALHVVKCFAKPILSKNICNFSMHSVWENIYSCDFLIRPFLSTFQPKNFFIWSHDLGFQCILCGKTFKTLFRFSMHSVLENIYNCTLCNDSGFWCILCISNSVSVFNAFCASKLLRQSLENKNIPSFLCGKIFKTRSFSTIFNYLVQCSDNRTCS